MDIYVVIETFSYDTDPSYMSREYVRGVYSSLDRAIESIKNLNLEYAIIDDYKLLDDTEYDTEGYYTRVIKAIDDKNARLDRYKITVSEYQVDKWPMTLNEAI